MAVGIPRPRDSYRRGDEGPHGLVAFDCDRVERASSAVRGAGPGLREFFLGPSPMDLAFPAGLVLMVLLSAIITAQVAGDGRSDWLKGLQLLAVYLIFGLAFFFLPNA